MYRKVSEPEWVIRERQIKNWQVREDEVRVGGEYIYRGAHTITYGADYFAECIYITPHHIGLKMTIDQGSAACPMERYGAARSYVWSIPRRDLGSIERLYYRR
jgi:hypothetical protein